MKRPRVLNIITPTRKKAVAALSRRYDKKAARECLSNDKIRLYIVNKIGQIVRGELKKMCTSNSKFTCHSPEDLSQFNWNEMYDQLQQNTPVFLSIMESATQTRANRCNRVAVICAAVLLKFRFQKINLVQKVVSLILYSGHASKEVYVYINFVLKLLLNYSISGAYKIK